jgi:hypothetical protein
VTVTRRTPLAAFLLLVASALTLVSAPRATAVEDYSQHQPPPLCSQPHTGYCVQQPHPGLPATTPLGIDMPTMNRDSTSQGSLPTGYVTFTITQGAGEPGYVARTPNWAGPLIHMLPIPGYAATGAGEIVFSKVGSCAGAWSCTYSTNATSMAGGWYWAANGNNVLATQDLCPPDSPNFVYGCFHTGSESAMYIAEVDELQPPVVRMATASQGRQARAIAEAEDPAGQPLSLTWNWGDGTTSPGAPGVVATHTYAGVANFVVTATATATDGRYGTDSAESGVLPPPPVLQSVTRVGSSTNGVVTALLQGWPAGAKTLVYGWTGGCPADPAAGLDAADVFYPGFSWVAALDDGTVSRAINSMQPDPAGYAVVAQTYLEIDGTTYLVYGVSGCMTANGTVATTTGATAVGATEVPVDSSSVEIGHLAVIDAGTANAEQRRVVDHGSLILQTPLAKAHAAGAQVVDAGLPVPPYVDPPAPADPVAPELPRVDQTAGSGGTPPGTGPGTGTGTTKTAPAAPTVTKTRLKGGKLKVSFRPGGDGGSPITSYLASCAAKGGKTRTASGTALELTVKKPTKGKKYKCKVQAVNAVGASPWSKPGKAVKVPAVRG